MSRYLCKVEMDFDECDDEDEAVALMNQAMRNGDCVIEVEELEDP